MTKLAQLREQHLSIALENTNYLGIHEVVADQLQMKPIQGVVACVEALEADALNHQSVIFGIGENQIDNAGKPNFKGWNVFLANRAWDALVVIGTTMEDHQGQWGYTVYQETSK